MENHTDNYTFTIPGGAFLIARKIFASELWETKPAWWLKVWIHILGKANFKDHNLKLRRGDIFTTYAQIHYDCKLKVEGIQESALENVIRWLKSSGQITTRKTTRGFIITVRNFNKYQNISLFKNYTQTATVNRTENYIGTIQELHDKGTKGNNEEKDNTVLVTTLEKNNPLPDITPDQADKLFDSLSQESGRRNRG